mmetsp:Transcript_19819/g.47320  ORF Transcript_19819/g.47320 Transcript_19819/m.47320 type:complete len:277 (+) Transcript_19819:68-898(+)
MYGTYVPGCGYGHLTPRCNVQSYVDKLLLTPPHMYDEPTYLRLPECSACAPGYCNKTGVPSWCYWDGFCPDDIQAQHPEWCEPHFDPEGFISSVSAPLSAILGLQFGHVLTMSLPTDDRYRLVEWSRLTVASLVFGLVFHFSGFQPLNLNLYSLSTVLVEGAIGGGFLVAFYAAVDARYLPEKLRLLFQHLLSPFSWAGKNAIFIYTMAAADVFESVQAFFYWKYEGNDLIHLIQRRLFKSWLSDAPATLLFVLCKIAFWFAVAGVLHHRKWYWKI